MKDPLGTSKLFLDFSTPKSGLYDKVIQYFVSWIVLALYACHFDLSSLQVIWKLENTMSLILFPTPLPIIDNIHEWYGTNPNLLNKYSEIYLNVKEKISFPLAAAV